MEVVPDAPSEPPAVETPLPSPSLTPAPRAAASRSATAWRFPILMYHVIAAPTPPDDLPALVVSPTLFDAQLQALQDSGWTTITVAQLNLALDAGARPPRHTLAISFDDGHADGFANAFPILEKHGFVGTFYVITGRLGWDGYLTPYELLMMTASGMEIANHTVDHVDLAALSQAKAQAEVAGAQDAIGAATGIPPLTLAYPFGSYSAAAIRIVGAAGLGMATTTVEGCSVSVANRLAVPRVRVGPGTTPKDLLATLASCSG